MNHSRRKIALLVPGLLLATGAFAAPRDVQITEVGIMGGIITLHNFGPTDQPLDGFRFCTQDDNETFRYSGFSGLNGFTIEAGTDFFIYYNDDAPSGPDFVNRSTIGGFFATPLDTGPYSLALYFPPVAFANGNTMADFAQWNIDGIDNIVADERSDEAQTGGLWTDQMAWIVTQPVTESIILKAASGGAILHGPDDYRLMPALPIPGDINGDGTVDTADLGAFIGIFGTSNPLGDLNGDMMVDTADLGILIANFGRTS